MNLNQLAMKAQGEHQEASASKFSLQSKKTLRVRVDQGDVIFTRIGAMIGWTGTSMSFSREGILQGGVGKALLRMVAQKLDSAENIKLMKCTGAGVVYLAHAKSSVNVLLLAEGEKLVCDGDKVLAFESSVKWSHRFNRGLRSGGLMQLELSGPGFVALLSSG